MTAGEVCNSRRQRRIAHVGRQHRPSHENRHVGDLVVVGAPNSERQPVGIVTDRDIALAADRLLQRPR